MEELDTNISQVPLDTKTVEVKGIPTEVPSKAWYTSKTIWIALATALLGILTTVQAQYPDLGWIVTGIGVVNFFLRMTTATAIK